MGGAGRGGLGRRHHFRDSGTGLSPGAEKGGLENSGRDLGSRDMEGGRGLEGVGTPQREAPRAPTHLHR